MTRSLSEVMGLLVGHQDTNDPRARLPDAQALAIEDSTSCAVGRNVHLSDQFCHFNEWTCHSNEKNCGWYHSHPDLEEYSHCYLSNTDVQTQLAWQRATEKDGDPWLAIVPIHCVQLPRLPQSGEFRVFPPEYTSIPTRPPMAPLLTKRRACSYVHVGPLL